MNHSPASHKLEARPSANQGGICIYILMQWMAHWLHYFFRLRWWGLSCDLGWPESSCWAANHARLGRSHQLRQCKFRFISFLSLSLILSLSLPLSLSLSLSLSFSLLFTLLFSLSFLLSCLLLFWRHYSCIYSFISFMLYLSYFLLMSKLMNYLVLKKSHRRNLNELSFYMIFLRFLFSWFTVFVRV